MKAMSSVIVISNPASFRDEARWQRVCAVCEQPGAFHAHHVIPKQQLRNLRRPQYDTRGALRLCSPGTVGNCHMQHEGGPTKLVTTKHLTQTNICYVFEVWGPAAEGWLERYYSGADDRLNLHHDEECPHCQS
jgi:hypothetical protein